MFDHIFLLVPAQTFVAQFLQTFQDYPPRQKAASFSMQQVLDRMEATLGRS
jgi:arylsulfatase